MFEKQQLQGVVHLRVILQLILNSGERSSRRASEEDRFDDGISINCIMMPNLHVRRGRGENRSG